MTVKDPNHEATVLIVKCEVLMVDILKVFVFFVFCFRYTNLKHRNAISNEVYLYNVKNNLNKEISKEC